MKSVSASPRLLLTSNLEWDKHFEPMRSYAILPRIVLPNIREVDKGEILGFDDNH